ncbi:ATP-dependent DNA helicase [uncultured Thiothrix sp.]|uniref:ATP-dependent DNA helicase n=1 Tax=uncultured Thiothrix sp. TaxID=223185 RepID=UPI002621187A|nr:ATP-dependent DNA helicase [uncultured Thiothrix sp.]HMT93228.1 ATP-dependent DNA helicase [Thiolinea sp.]
MSTDSEQPALAWLEEGGALAQRIEGFQPRPQQQAMAKAITELLAGEGVLIVEAGTGVGKTFAYLIPTLASGERVILSTGSKTLQDQLFFKDLPVVCEALKLPLKAALLKGRANYLCLQRLELTLEEGRFTDRREIGWIRRLESWSRLTETGDIAEMTAIPHDAEVWPKVTSTLENCSGLECEYYSDCFVVKARRKAQDADVVVVNHHLFFADMALKEEGFGELLPTADVIVLDEAHQLPEIASNFFSETISSRQLQEWSRDTLAEFLVNAKDMPQLRDQLNQLDKAVLDLRLVMDAPGQRASWLMMRDRPGIIEHTQTLLEVMQDLEVLLVEIVERSKGLELCHERLVELRERLLRMQMPQTDVIQWFETFTRSFSLTATPLDIAVPLQRCMETLPCRWVMTSATLAVGDSFEHFTKRLGINQAATLKLDSPFDYWHHALMYLPTGLPEPQQADFVEKMVAAAIPVIKACGGRTFMLFTSYRAMHEAAELLEGEFDYPMLIQGESPQREMIDKFRELGNAVLLGTASFWEGVDVRGEALSCVIIDKLPFAAPNDPVLEARLETLRQEGGNPFADYQLPQAVIALKQGVGRLIRDQEDRGLLMICDARLRTRRYGSVFLDSLPRMPRTQKLEVVERFFSTQPVKPSSILNSNENHASISS